MNFDLDYPETILKMGEAYLEAVDFTDGDQPDMHDENFIGFSDEMVNRAHEDCYDFALAVQSSLGFEGIDMTIEQFAHDFWLTRNHHGAGFWDRGLGDIGEKLTELAQQAGSCEVYVGDDGWAYFA